MKELKHQLKHERKEVDEKIDELVAFLDIQREHQTVSDAQLSLAETAIHDAGNVLCLD